MSTTLARIDYFMTAAFALECLIGIIVYGFIFNGPKSYLKDSWNILDFIIVFFSIFNIAASRYQLSYLKILRILRVLRPLRFLKRNLGLKIQVVSLFNSVPGIVNLMMISTLILMLFGIQGVTFFKGKFFFCDIPDSVPEFVHEEIVTKWDCMDYGGDWVRYA